MVFGKKDKKEKKELTMPPEPPKIEDSVLQDIYNRLKGLENAYQLVRTTKEQKQEKFKRIEEIEHNITAVMGNIDNALEIKIEGETMEEALKRIEEWLNIKPVGNFRDAAYNGYHTTKASIEAIKSLKTELEKLKLVLNTWKNEVDGQVQN